MSILKGDWRVGSSFIFAFLNELSSSGTCFANLSSMGFRKIFVIL